MHCSLAEAKRVLPIQDLWRKLALPGDVPRIGRKVASPFRADRSPSCMLYTGRNGEVRFADKSRGLDVDAIGFLALATGLTEREACSQFVRLAHGAAFTGGLADFTSDPPVIRPDPVRGRPVMPKDLHRGDRLELARVAAVRGLSPAGLALADERGFLRFGKVCGFPCWIVTDGSRALAQARRIDGQPFPAFLNVAERKSHTLRGSRQSWPVGIHEATSFPTLLLVEGGPDMLTACHFIARAKRDDLAPVAILGAGNRVPTDALALFAGKRIRIFPHADASGAGEAAAARWAEQLDGGGRAGPIDAFRFRGLLQADGSAVSDLNDLARMYPASQPENLLP